MLRKSWIHSIRQLVKAHRWPFGILAVGGLFLGVLWGMTHTVLAPRPDPVLIPASECAAFEHFERLSRDHFAINLVGDTTMFFLLKLEHVKGRAIQLDIRNVSNFWRTANPVFTYASDINDPATYVTAPVTVLDSSKLVKAPNGPLLPEGTGQQWQFVANSAFHKKARMLRISQTFEQDTVWVAMRYPCTPTLVQKYTASLQTRVNQGVLSGVKILSAGTTPEGRPMQVIKIATGTEAEQKRKPGVLIYAREHGAETDGGWVAQGAIEFLLSDDPEAVAIRDKHVFLILPLLDADGAVASAYERIAQTFDSDPNPPESVNWARFFRDWVVAGNRLELVYNLHNVQSTEGPHIFPPQLQARTPYIEAAKTLQPLIMDALTTAGYDIRNKARPGDSKDRLAGFIHFFYGALPQPYELNMQAPRRHLTLGELKNMGAVLVRSSAAFLASPAAQPVRAECQRRALWREAARARYAAYVMSQGIIMDEYLYSDLSLFELEWRAQKSKYPVGYEALERTPLPDSLQDCLEK
jgi:hypothetical protein